MHEKLIFIDLDDNILSSLKQELVKEGVHAEYFTSTEAVFEYLKHNPVSIVVSDIRMPDMDGVDVLKQIQNLYPDVYRVILSCSDFNDQRTREAFENRTIEQWLDKNKGISELLEYLRTFESNDQYFTV
ncbi:MAG: response regulator [Desulfuromonadales bacterium]|nr:response regulator [Desulfuromonadales bacterium]MBN2792323.1 response regulator [Desulfuromonadales bacterium]